MASPHAHIALKIMEKLRGSACQPQIIRLLANIHNWSYHTLSFFAQTGSRHPKHDIQQYHRFFIENITPSDRVLDIGCGSGEVANSVSRKAKTVLGIDFSASSIAQARQQYQRENLSFIVGDALSYELPSAFDAIILSNVLEHIDNRISFLQKLSRLAPRLLIRVPLLTRDWITVYKKDQGLEYRLDDTHCVEYTEDILRQELALSGWEPLSEKIFFGELYVVARRSSFEPS